MELDKRAHITGKWLKLDEKEIMPVIEKHLKRIENIVMKSSDKNYRKLVIPLNRHHMEILAKLVKEKLGVEIEYVPIISYEKVFAVTIKKLNR